MGEVQVRNQSEIVKIWFLKGALTMLLISSAVAVHAASFSVDFEVSDNGKKLLITNDQPDGKKCPAMVPPPAKGCMFVKHKAVFRTANITFKLEAEVACGVNKDGIWKLREVYLGNKDTAEKPANPGDWGSLDDKVQVDFDVNDASTGLLNPSKLTDSGGGSIKIKNKNKSKYYIWYKVVAKCMKGSVDMGGSITTDPRVVNEGRR